MTDTHQAVTVFFTQLGGYDFRKSSQIAETKFLIQGHSASNCELSLHSRPTRDDLGAEYRYSSKDCYRCRANESTGTDNRS